MKRFKFWIGAVLTVVCFSSIPSVCLWNAPWKAKILATVLLLLVAGVVGGVSLMCKASTEP